MKGLIRKESMRPQMLQTICVRFWDKYYREIAVLKLFRVTMPIENNNRKFFRISVPFHFGLCT